MLKNILIKEAFPPVSDEELARFYSVFKDDEKLEALLNYATKGTIAETLLLFRCHIEYISNLQKNPKTITHRGYLSYVKDESWRFCCDLMRWLKNKNTSVTDYYAHYTLRGHVCAISSSFNFVVVVTKNYFNRKYRLFELLTAELLSKPIIVLLETDPQYHWRPLSEFENTVPKPWAFLKDNILKINRDLPYEFFDSVNERLHAKKSKREVVPRNNKVPQYIAQRVLFSVQDDEKKNQEVEKSNWKFLSLQDNRDTPAVWDFEHPFDAKSSYIGIVDLNQETCYVEEPKNFKSENDISTFHKEMMERLGRWKDYEKWIKNPRKPKNYLNLQSYAGFARFGRKWLPHSCTLNAAHSGKSEKLVLEAIMSSGEQGLDKAGKKEGLHIMKPFIWNTLKEQLDKITK